MFPPAPNNLNVPLPDPSPLVPQDVLAAHAQPQSDPSAAMNLIAPLFALGASFGGSPSAGGALLKGMHGALADREKARALKQHQDEQMAQQQAVLAETIANHEAEQEAKRQAGIQKLITRTAEQVKGLPKPDYDVIMDANDQMAGAFYGLRPNALRSAVPFRVPDSDAIMGKAGEDYLKNPINAGALADGNFTGTMMLDLQGDKKPVPVPIADILAKTPGVVIDPETRKPIVHPKLKPVTDPDRFSLVYTGLVAKYKADKGGQEPDDIERGKLAVEAQRALDKPPAASTGGGGGGTLSKADQRLVASIMRKPEIYGDLTPTIKGRIDAALEEAGFGGFGKQINESAITKIAESKSAIASLQDLRKTLQENEQYIGPIAGLQALNPYSGARAAQAKIDLVKQRVGKALEGGVLRKEDEEKYKRILATLRDTPETAITKVDQLIESVTRDMQTFEETQKAAGRNMGGLTPKPAQTGAGPAVGSIVTLRGVGKVKVDKVNPDGTFDYTVVR